MPLVHHRAFPRTVVMLVWLGVSAMFTSNSQSPARVTVERCYSVARNPRGPAIVVTTLRAAGNTL